MTQQEIDMIIKDYNEGKTFNYLTKTYHHKYQTIRKILEDNEVHIRNKSEAGTGVIKKDIPQNIQNKIIEKYNQGCGLVTAGLDFGISAYKVRKILVSNNIPIRSQSNSASISNSKRKKFFCNEDFFKKQSAKMAYILGFLAADGTVSKNSNEVKITLSEIDAELLEKIKDTLEYTGEVKHAVTSKGFSIATLQITCAEYKKDLAQYNIVPQKTFTFSIPEKLDKKYWIDFIRGYWDGDGTICTAGKEAIRSSLCSARKETLEQILNFLQENYQIPKVSIQFRQGIHPLYYFQYSTNSTKKLFSILYYHNVELFLDRKYTKFCELCIDNKYPRGNASDVSDEKLC